MARLDAFFRKMVELEASDLHMTTSLTPYYRLHGDMVPVNGDHVWNAEEMKKALFEITPQSNIDQFEAEGDTDFAYEISGLARFRANLFMDRLGPSAVFRQIPEEILTADQLNLPKCVRDLCYLSKGLVLVTGPTGSGKSTTLAAMVDLVNKSRGDHIITIEDPVEFVHKSQRCLVHQREVGRHTQSFKRALRAALREDPDIILVGELRDLETIEIAIETAETGHLVFGTLHTTTAASTVDRLIDQFPADRQAQIRTMLSGSLKGVIAQTLCKKKPKGRIAALEIMLGTQAIAALIREGKTHQITSQMQMGAKNGMKLLNDSLVELVKGGIVDPTEAYIKSVNKEELIAKLAHINIQVDLAKANASSAPAPSAATSPATNPDEAGAAAPLECAPREAPVAPPLGELESRG
ncbi:MAG: type IV pilus twitching motility protein PilT, partial [Planctomycetota bacterium]